MPGHIDVHAHLAALPDGKNGCLISKKMLGSPAAKMVAKLQGLPLDKPEEANKIYVAGLEAELDRAQSVEAAVILAMDGVYGSDGKLDEGHTEFLISNDHLFASIAGKKKMLAGVSINPARRDALDELERCAAKKAALVKLLPNAMAFDPGEDRFRPYYRKLSQLKIPMLSHIGFEYSLIGHDQSVGNPERLIPALEEGATVIAAHGCSRGLFLGEPHQKTMMKMIKQYPNFYIDLSALTLPNRVGALFNLRKYPEAFERLLFGTDYPLPGFSWPALFGGGWLHARAADNRFDRHVRVLSALGITAGADFRKISPNAASF